MQKFESIPRIESLPKQTIKRDLDRIFARLGKHWPYSSEDIAEILVKNLRKEDYADFIGKLDSIVGLFSSLTKKDAANKFFATKEVISPDYLFLHFHRIFYNKNINSRVVADYEKGILEILSKCKGRSALLAIDSFGALLSNPSYKSDFLQPFLSAVLQLNELAAKKDNSWITQKFTDLKNIVSSEDTSTKKISEFLQSLK
ncbi:MAG: hypothetical protein QXT25_03900 [Candidatus Anstonellaceae archaeon]